MKTVSCLPHWESTLYIFPVYFWECVQVVWSGIQACPRKYAFTCHHHNLLGFKWNIIKHTDFPGQVKVAEGQVKIESHLPYRASRCKSECRALQWFVSFDIGIGYCIEYWYLSIIIPIWLYLICCISFVFFRPLSPGNGRILQAAGRHQVCLGGQCQTEFPRTSATSKHQRYQGGQRKYCLLVINLAWS